MGENIEIFNNGVSTGTIVPVSNKIQIKSAIDFAINQAQHYNRFIRLRGYRLKDGETALGYGGSKEAQRARWRLADDLIKFI